MDEILTHVNIMGGTSPIIEELIRENLDNRVIILNDAVDECILENITLQILKFNQEDIGLPEDKRKPIKLFIQSPGGNMIDGFNLIDVIEASITPVYTICFSNSCSMAFHLFITGKKRYAFKNSILLNHDGDIELRNSGSKAKDTMDFIEKLNERVKNHVLGYTKMDSDFYDSIYEKEFYMFADDKAKELGCVDYIIGEDATLDSILS